MESSTEFVCRAIKQFIVRGMVHADTRLPCARCADRRPHLRDRRARCQPRDAAQIRRRFSRVFADASVNKRIEPRERPNATISFAAVHEVIDGSSAESACWQQDAHVVADARDAQHPDFLYISASTSSQTIAEFKEQVQHHDRSTRAGARAHAQAVERGEAHRQSMLLRAPSRTGSRHCRGSQITRPSAIDEALAAASTRCTRKTGRENVAMYTSARIAAQRHVSALRFSRG